MDGRLVGGGRVETLDTSQFRAPAGVDQLDEFNAGKTVAHEATTSQLPFDLLTAEGELRADTIDVGV